MFSRQDKGFVVVGSVKIPSPTAVDDPRGKFSDIAMEEIRDKHFLCCWEFGYGYRHWKLRPLELGHFRKRRNLFEMGCRIRKTSHNFRISSNIFSHGGKEDSFVLVELQVLRCRCLESES